MSDPKETSEVGPKRPFFSDTVAKLFVLLAIFFVLYFVKLASFRLSIDDEISAMRDDAGMWIEQGRWTTYLWELLVLPQPVVPFLPVFLFGFFLACGYILLIKCFNLPNPIEAHFAAFALFCGFPIWYFLLEFQANTPAAGLGVLIACAAVTTLGRAIEVKERGGLLSLPALGMAAAAGGLGAAAIGTYQSNLMLLGALALGLVIWKSRANARTGLAGIFSSLLLVLAMLGVSVIIYSIILILFKLSLHISTNYIDSILIPSNLYYHTGSTLSETFNEMLRVYTGAAPVYGIHAYAFGAIIVAGLSGLCSWGFPNRFVLITLVSLALIILFIPFALNLISASPGTMPYRTLVGVPAVVWFFTLLAFSARWQWLVRSTKLIVAVSFFHMLYIGNIFEAASASVRQHDLVTAASIYDRIAEVNQNFDRTKPYKVDFIGPWTFSPVYPKISSSTIGASFFEWDDGNPIRILAYMRILGYSNLQPVTPDQRKLLGAVVESMPLWPASGSVRVEGDVTLVKLGRTS